MMLPFLLGLIAILCALVRRRTAAIIVWIALMIVLAAWLVYHSTSPLGLAF